MAGEWALFEAIPLKPQQRALLDHSEAYKTTMNVIVQPKEDIEKGSK
jgi:hypothetical protein